MSASDEGELLTLRSGRAIRERDPEAVRVVDAAGVEASVEVRRPGARMRRGWLVRRLLLAADVAGLTVAFVFVELFFGTSSLIGHIGVATESAIFVVLLPVWAVAAKLYGLYDRDEELATHSTLDEIVSVFHLVTVAVWLFYATSWIVRLASPSQPKLATFWALALVSVIAARSSARAVARRRPSYIQNALIVGAGDVGQLIGRKLLQHPEYKINLVGFVDAEPKERRPDLGDVP